MSCKQEASFINKIIQKLGGAVSSPTAKETVSADQCPGCQQEKLIPITTHEPYNWINDRIMKDHRYAADMVFCPGCKRYWYRNPFGNLVSAGIEDVIGDR